MIKYPVAKTEKLSTIEVLTSKALIYSYNHDELASVNNVLR